MRSCARKNAVATVTAGMAIFAVAWLGLTRWMGTDYNLEARPAFDALVSGHLLQFLQIAPAYGGSLLMRAPFVLVPRLWGAGQLAIYRAAAAPCLLASAVFGVWLLARMRALGRDRIAMALALLACVANPITLVALHEGHPEELLGAVLCVAAVLLAMSDRPVWSGVLLGLAIANKEWALLATGPVLLALGDRRPRALLSAVGVAAIFTAPFLLAGSGGFAAAVKSAAVQPSPIFNPWQAWWFFGSHGHIVRDLNGAIKVGYRTPPGWIGSIAHPLIVAMTVPLTLLCVWLRRRGYRRPRHEALLLLVLLLLLRCLLDPWDTLYYSLPLLFALLAWETLTFARPPVLAVVAPFLAWVVFYWTPHPLSPDRQATMFLLVATAVLITSAVALYLPGARAALAQRLRLRINPAALEHELGDHARGGHVEQEADALGDVLRTDHVLGGDALLDEVGHRRVHERRAQRARLDSLGEELLVHRLGEPDHRVLGRRVHRQPRLPRLAGDRGRVDDDGGAVLGRRGPEHVDGLAVEEHE
jgi:Glycosyltransferase family 87